jgi:ribosomal protein L40E
VITIDLICEVCGEPNPPGTEFCRNCNAFLAWDSPTARRQPSTATSTTTTVPTPAVEQTVPTVAQPVPDQTYVDQGYSDQGYVDQGYDQQSAEQAHSELVCPTCGTVNPPTRRYCAHCGYSFVAEYGTDPSVDWSAWTPQAMAARDREARKAYRRSLPPLYRWRRVIIAVLVFALLVGVGALLRRNPVALARDGWYRLTKEYVTVGGVRVQVNPTTASAPGSDPQNLVDGSVQEWTMTWTPSGESGCGAAPGTGTVIVTFPATRVRQVLIVPGLDKSNPQRDLQPQPRVIGLSFADGPCRPVTLANSPEQPPIEVDSGVPVTQLRLGIGSTYPAGGDAKPLISLTEVIIRAYPS